VPVSSSPSVPTTVPSSTAPPTTNAAPSISGTAGTTATAGTVYTFQPTATDPEGGALTFAIVGRPIWATFSTATGRLSGTPAASDVGSASGITISVSDGSAIASLPAFSIAVSAAATGANRPPVISGTATRTITVGATYTFQPSASDPDGNTLTFAIQGKPSWATFSTATGRLTGAPTVADVGASQPVTISVSDGSVTTALASFTITVAQVANGSATLVWSTPTLNTDGSTLSGLTGYQILYGTSPASLNQTLQISNPSLTTAIVENLSPGTWYFAIKALATGGQASVQTNVASRIIQ